MRELFTYRRVVGHRIALPLILSIKVSETINSTRLFYSLKINKENTRRALRWNSLVY